MLYSCNLTYSCSWDKPSSLQSSFEGLLSFLLVHVSRIKRRYLCEVFSSPHLCHCPLRSTWMPPYRILFPGEVWTLLMEKVKVGGWRDGQGAVLMKESSVSEKDYLQWKYFQFDSNHHLDPPLVSLFVWTFCRNCSVVASFTMLRCYCVSMYVCTLLTYVCTACTVYYCLWLVMCQGYAHAVCLYVYICTCCTHIRRYGPGLYVFHC